MSRKTNKLRGRVRIAEAATRKATDKATRAASEAKRLTAEKGRSADGSIVLSLRPDSLGGGARYGRETLCLALQILPDSVFHDFHRSGGMPDVSVYLYHLTRDIAEKASKALHDYFQKKMGFAR